MPRRLALPLAGVALLAAAATPAHAATKAGAERAVERHLERVYGVEADAACDRSRYLRTYTCLWTSPLALEGQTGRVCSREGEARVTWPAGRYRVVRSAERQECPF